MTYLNIYLIFVPLWQYKISDQTFNILWCNKWNSINTCLKLHEIQLLDSIIDRSRQSFKRLTKVSNSFRLPTTLYRIWNLEIIWINYYFRFPIDIFRANFIPGSKYSKCRELCFYALKSLCSAFSSLRLIARFVWGVLMAARMLEIWLQLEASAKWIAIATRDIVVECGLSKDVENVAKIRTAHRAKTASKYFCFFLI